MRVPALRLLAAAGLVLAAVSVSGFSSATFTAGTASQGGVSAAADWTPPSVSVASPGTVTGTVSLTATASDQHSAVASVTIQRSTDGTSWTSLCTRTAAPYTCSWDTTTVADGTHQLRAVAADTFANSATSPSATATVANAASVRLGVVPAVVRGDVPLSATVSAPGGAAVDLRIQQRVSGAGTWQDVPGCAATAPSVSCTWGTGSLAGTYDVRARAVVGSSTLLDMVTGLVVDNVAPTVTLSAPAGPWSGTVRLSATADDAHSGLADVRFHYAPNGSSTWTDLCLVSAAPYTCDWKTSGVTDGSYSVRAVATDRAGNTATTPSQQRTVSNTVASVSVVSPGSPVSGTVTVGANASSSNGVKNVLVRWAPAGTSSWTTLCTATAAPYGCPWNTLTATTGSGSFDLQAVLTDNLDLVFTSERVAVTVDNTALRGHDVQTLNVGAAGKVDPGDQLVLTWSTVVDPATVVTGWNGTGSRAVTVSLNENGTSDTLTFTGANLGSVALGRNFTDRTLTFPSTLTHSVSTAGGVSRSVLTVTFGTPSDPTALRTVTSTAHMVWTPSGLVRTPSGVVAATTATTETGTLDRDF